MDFCLKYCFNFRSTWTIIEKFSRSTLDLFVSAQKLMGVGVLYVFFRIAYYVFLRGNLGNWKIFNYWKLPKISPTYFYQFLAYENSFNCEKSHHLYQVHQRAKREWELSEAWNTLNWNVTKLRRFLLRGLEETRSQLKSNKLLWIRLNEKANSIRFQYLIPNSAQNLLSHSCD